MYRTTSVLHRIICDYLGHCTKDGFELIKLVRMICGADNTAFYAVSIKKANTMNGDVANAQHVVTCGIISQAR